MDVLMEFLGELILEGSVELSKSKKVPKWIRYPLIVIILLLFLIVDLLFIFVSLLLMKENLFGGILFSIFTIIFIVMSIVKFKKMYFKKKKVINNWNLSIIN